METKNVMKNSLLSLLDDNDVKMKIIGLVNSFNNSYEEENPKNENNYRKMESKTEELEKKNLNLKIEVEKLLEEKENIINKLASEKLKIDSLEKGIKKLQEDYNKLLNSNKELKWKKSCLDEKNKEYNAFLKEEKEIYKVYLNLSEENKKVLKGIFKSDTLESFLYCGVQYNNIDSLWEYIKTLIINNNLENIKELKDIFHYFLNAHNKIYDNPIFILQEVFIGENFDEDNHMRGFNSKIQGAIQEIYLQGYINNKTKKNIKKSIVKV